MLKTSPFFFNALDESYQSRGQSQPSFSRVTMVTKVAIMYHGRGTPIPEDIKDIKRDTSDIDLTKTRMFSDYL